MSDITLFALHSSQIDDWWPRIRPLIERCEGRQFEWSSNLVRVKLKDADAQFWGVMQDDQLAGAFVTQLEKGACGLIGRVWIVAGDLKEHGLAVYRGTIEPWFADKGCDVITFEGRKGWQKILPDYSVHSVKMVKNLCSTSVH